MLVHLSHHSHTDIWGSSSTLAGRWTASDGIIITIHCRAYECVCHSLFTLAWSCTARLKRDGTRAETRFCLSPKRTSPFKSAGESVQSTAGSRVVRIRGSNAGYTTFRDSVRVLATHSIRQFPLHFPSRASPCAIRFQTHYT